ncbi:hypothetical protein J1N35_040327, partial [Gossypium stocksii]
QMQASTVEQISQLKAEAEAREAQMQASIVEQISRLKAEAKAREAEQDKKYNELQLQLQTMMTMF